MKYYGAKTVNERWAYFNAIRPFTTTAGTELCEQPEPEFEQSEVALALINQLPDDVLCYIFTLHCREKTNTVRLPFNHTNISPQVTISHVCSIWRDVILNMPSLWNDFEVLMDNAKDGDMLMSIVYDWLFRARSLSCSLTLDFGVDNGIPGALKQERWYSGIIKHLISQFRFRKLSTPWSSTHWIQFLQLPAEQLSCIEDLHICCINPPSISNFGVLSSEDGFKKLTQLTSLRLDQSTRQVFDQIVYSKDPVFAHVPWHQLRHIFLTIPTSVFLCLTILQGSSMVLETCCFFVSGQGSRESRAGDGSKHTRPPYAEPLYCPQLRTLGLRACHNRFDYSPILDQILLGIRVPNLKSLVIYDRISRNIVSSSTLAVMQDVSNMQLEELGFYYQDEVAIDIRHLLTTFPSLKGVEVTGRTFLNNDTISQLGSGLIGPCLEHLMIRSWDIDLEKLLRMVEVRSGIGKPVNRDEWQVAKNEPTSFKYVKFYIWPTVIREKFEETIEKINLCGVQLVVEQV